MKRRLESLRLLDGLLRGLLAITPQPGAAPKEILAAAGQFLGQFARAVNEFDNYALQALAEEIQGMQGWLEQVGGELSHDFREWLAGLVDQVRVGGSGPRPGCLHVAHALAGGHSGRPVTFIVGLDDSRFPGAGLQDPLLLDHERQALSPKLPTAAGRLKEKLDKFARLLARLRGRIVLSYCCHDLADDREMFPSPVILAAFRILSGKHDGDQTDLLRWLPPPASFAPQSAERCLDEADWWLWRLCGPEAIGDLRGPCGRAVSRTWAAASGRRLSGQARSSRPSTEWSPRPVRTTIPPSLTGRYCRPAAWRRSGVARWRGSSTTCSASSRPRSWWSIRHDGSILWRSARSCTKCSGSSWRTCARRTCCRRSAATKGKLTKILDQQIAVYRELCPPPNESVFRAQRRQLDEAAQIFLAGEEEFCQQSCPEYLEASLGMTTEDEPSPLDDPEPIAVSLPGGRKFRARGRIDRVDRIGDESSCQFLDLGLQDRTHLQEVSGCRPVRPGQAGAARPVLTMAESVLKRKVNRKAVVEQAGYYFPTGRGQGERIVRTREQLAGAGGSDAAPVPDRCQRRIPGHERSRGGLRLLRLPDWSATTWRRPRLPASSSWTTAGTKP